MDQMELTGFLVACKLHAILVLPLRWCVSVCWQQSSPVKCWSYCTQQFRFFWYVEC